MIVLIVSNTTLSVVVEVHQTLQTSHPQHGRICDVVPRSGIFVDKVWPLQTTLGSWCGVRTKVVFQLQDTEIQSIGGKVISEVDKQIRRQQRPLFQRLHSRTALESVACGSYPTVSLAISLGAAEQGLKVANPGKYRHWLLLEWLSLPMAPTHWFGPEPGRSAYAHPDLDQQAEGSKISLHQGVRFFTEKYASLLQKQGASPKTSSRQDPM